MTPPQARNAIIKALVRIVDPNPKKADIDAMWAHFGSSCAFCGTALIRENRHGHSDHLVSSTQGGRNHVFNRVLSCGLCNGDHKLDKPWIDFLRRKNPDEDDFTRRKNLIEAWQETHRGACKVLDDDVWKAMAAAERAVEAFNQECDKVRSLRTGNPEIF